MCLRRMFGMEQKPGVSFLVVAAQQRFNRTMAVSAGHCLDAIFETTSEKYLLLRTQGSS